MDIYIIYNYLYNSIYIYVLHMMSHMSHCIKEGYDGYEPFAIPLNCQNIQASGISGSIWAPV